MVHEITRSTAALRCTSLSRWNRLINTLGKGLEPNLRLSDLDHLTKSSYQSSATLLVLVGLSS